MTDYHQPDFYRFNEDSLTLVREIVKLNLQPQNLLDIGAGSGVIGIELALKLDIPTIHFLELQKEWEAYLSKNIGEYLPGRRTMTFWCAIGEWRPEIKYDLIVSNPPYYLPKNGRTSPDAVRARCRSFLQDNWQLLLEKSYSALSPGGNAFFVTAPENHDHVINAGRGLPLEAILKGKIVIFKLSSTGYR